MKFSASVAAAIGVLAVGSVAVAASPDAADARRVLAVPLVRRAASHSARHYSPPHKRPPRASSDDLDARDDDRVVDWAHLERMALHVERRYSPSEDAESQERMRKRWVNLDKLVGGFLEGDHAKNPVLPGDAADRTTAEKSTSNSNSNDNNNGGGFATPSGARMLVGPSTTGQSRVSRVGQPNPSATPFVENGKNALLSLNDYVAGGRDTEFLGQVSIGTPPKTFLLDLDTGSSDLWVESTDCSANCGTNRTKYSTSQSSTSHNVNQNFDLTYGVGNVQGTTASDNVSIGAIQVQNQVFGVATKLSSDWKDDVAEGVFGMGFPSLAVTKQKPWIQQVVEQHKLDQNVFAFAFGRYSSYTAGQSELTIGGIDEYKFTGQIQYRDLSNQGYWQFRMAGIGSGPSHSLSVTGIDAIADTGTTLMALPADQAAKFWANVKGSQSAGQGQGYWTYPCSQNVSMVVDLGQGYKVHVDERDMNLGQDKPGSDRCIGAVFGTNTNGLAILGLAFLKSVYTVYDYGAARIGFATPIY